MLRELIAAAIQSERATIASLRQEVEDLREALGKSVDDIERERTALVENWAGDPADLDDAYANQGSALLICLIKEIRKMIAMIQIRNMVPKVVSLLKERQGGEAAATETLIAGLRALPTDEARMDVLSEFCRHCGSLNRGCQCWNDE